MDHSPNPKVKDQSKVKPPLPKQWGKTKHAHGPASKPKPAFNKTNVLIPRPMKPKQPSQPDGLPLAQSEIKTFKKPFVPLERLSARDRA